LLLFNKAGEKHEPEDLPTIIDASFHRQKKKTESCRINKAGFQPIDTPIERKRSIEALRIQPALKTAGLIRIN
jgi:hypothetical protein